MTWLKEDLLLELIHFIKEQRKNVLENIAKNITNESRGGLKTEDKEENNYGYNNKSNITNRCG